MFLPPPPIEPSIIHAPCIAEWKNVWANTDYLIEEIEEEVKNSHNIYFQDATISNGRINSHRTNSHLGVNVAATKNEFFRNLNNDYYLTLLAASEWYRNFYGITETFDHVESYNLLRYQTGEEYKSHYDGGIADQRSISPILYLNDDYEGGELEFTNFGLKIKPEAGSLFIFPSNFPYSHIAHPVTNGTKYAIVTWLHEIN
jgi:predicted 2-oxoglutarate/Fe(II)-dependent dioxygenase YbiX